MLFESLIRGLGKTAEMRKNCLSVLAWHVVNKFQEGGGGDGGVEVVVAVGGCWEKKEAWGRKECNHGVSDASPRPLQWSGERGKLCFLFRRPHSWLDLTEDDHFKPDQSGFCVAFFSFSSLLCTLGTSEHNSPFFCARSLFSSLPGIRRTSGERKEPKTQSLVLV